MKLLSVVFQDFKLMSFSIKENIALNDFNKVKDEEIEEVLIKSGFGKDLEKLPKGINTPVYKNFDEVQETLIKHNMADDAVMISRVGLPDEQVFVGLDNMPKDTKLNYLSTILAKRKDR